MYSNKRPYNRMTVLLQLTHNISTHTHIHHTAGFTIFPHIVAIVHTDPFVVDLYHHYRRRTHTEVPRHFSFFFTFFGKPELRDFYEHRHHGHRWPWPLYRRPRPEDARSGATRLLPISWATPHPLGSIKFVEGGRST